MSLIAYNNRLHATRETRVAFTDTGGTFSSAQPLSNLGRMQLPLFAEFTGDADFDCAAVDADDNPEQFTADVFAVLGHTLPDGAEVEFLDGSTSLGSVTVANHRGLPQHAILVLNQAVTLDTLTIKVTNGDGRIGAVWASSSFRPKFGAEVERAPQSLSQVSRAEATAYANKQATVREVSVKMPKLSRAEAIGPDWPNWEAITMDVGIHAPVLLTLTTDNKTFPIYGLVSGYAPTRTTVPKRWRGGLTVLEVR